MFNFYYIFLTFITYSILGWIIESTYCSIFEKKIINRGFLIGPYCPIYGSAAVVIILTLSSFKNNFIAIFFLSMILSGILEYITSYMLEKIFKLSLWDYSTYKFNINGRVCLRNLLMFGALAVLLIEFINPVVDVFYEIIPENVTMAIFFITLICFTADIILTSIAVFDIRKMANKTLDLDELTNVRNEVTTNVRTDIESKAESLKFNLEDKSDRFIENLENKSDLVRKKLEKLSKVRVNFTHIRFMKAFPKLKSINANESIENLKKVISKLK